VADFESRALPLLFEAATGSDSVRAVITTTGPAAAGHHGDSWIDEDARGPASSFGGVQRAVEERTLEAAARGIPAVVLRPGAVYGPDGGFAARVLRTAKRGRVVYAGDGRNYVSWVHIEDYAAAYERAASGAGTGYVIAVVDDEPFTSRDAMTLLAELAGAKAPLRIPVPIVRALRGPVIAGWATQSARVHNQRAGRLLAWRPTRPSIREGFREVLASFEQDQRGPRADREQRAQARPSAGPG
jgi:nucleoside-diphosphate-sugar epimerase